MSGYTVKRSSRKTMSLEITRDLTVLVRAPLWMPQSEIERFVTAQQRWIAEHKTRMQKRQQRQDALSPEQIDALRRRAEELLPARTAYYAAQMGVCPTGVKITSARTRFGSCSAKNSICYSWRLMLYPPEAIDYVVVHELAHIRHKNHSAAFHAEIARILPDHLTRRALLRDPK